MNKQQLAFVIAGIWGIIAWILMFFVSDAQIEYIAGQFGIGLVVAGVCIGFALFLATIVYGIIYLYSEVLDD